MISDSCFDERSEAKYSAGMLAPCENGNESECIVNYTGLSTYWYPEKCMEIIASKNYNDSLSSSQPYMSRTKVLVFTFSSIAVLFMIVVASCTLFKVRKHRLVTQTHSIRNLPETPVIFNVEGDYCRIILERRLLEIPINRDNSVDDEEYECITEYDSYSNGTYVTGARLAYNDEDY